MIMELTAQIPDVTVGRAANTAHYEYLATARESTRSRARWKCRNETTDKRC